MLVFPSEQGRAWDFENNGMVDAVADLIEAGRVKLYCVDSADAYTWSNHAVPLEERARRHDGYEAWVVDHVVPWIAGDCGGPAEILTLGCSLGAFHAANFALKRADLFPLALCLSGNYDPTGWNGWGERGDATYFNNPMDYVGQPDGDHLDWLREPAEPAARRRPGRVGGASDRARCRARARSPALLAEQGHPARAGRVGVRRPARLAVLAGPAARITCRGSAEGATV